ncbi:MAG: hypothetical protein ACRD4Q_09980, partial [Candidatus Acidiferrales bacterium]
TYGKLVSEIAGSGSPLPFSMFETYRENVQGKYWLPTYTNSDDYINGDDNTQLHLRLVIHSTNFQLNSSPSAEPAAETAPQEQKPSQRAAAPQN